MNLQRIAVLVLAAVSIMFLKGCADLGSSQKTIQYGKVLIGTSKSEAASWVNTTKRNLIVVSCSTYDDDANDIVVDMQSWNNADKDLDPNETFKVDMVFTPNRTGEHKTKARPYHESGRGDRIELSGYGVYVFGENGLGCSGGNSSDKAAMDFEKVVVGQTSTKTKRVELTNNTNKTIRIAISWGKGDQGFIIAMPTFPFELKPGESESVHIFFKPPREGSCKDGLYFKVIGGKGIGGVSVQGEGVLE